MTLYNITMNQIRATMGENGVEKIPEAIIITRKKTKRKLI